MIRKIILDAGHGGYDTGGVYQDRLEKDDNLLLALKLGEKLKEKGIDVVYTRDSDRYLTQSARVNIANKEGGDLLLTLHRNSSKRPDTYSGVIAYVNKEDNFEEEVANRILSNIKKGELNNLGVQIRSKIMQLDNSNIPSILLEVGFINTDVDNQYFDIHMDELVEYISEGILSFNYR